MRRYLKRQSKTNDAERLLTKEYLRETFSYVNGKLYWRANRGTNKCAGKEAGCCDSFGHRQICLNGVLFKTHRLVWIMFHGESCSQDIDHTNKQPDDNRIENLRPTTGQLNRANSKPNQKNSNGFKGVYFRKARNKFIGIIRVNGVKKYLGHYDTPAEAALAYNKAATFYFGEFATLNILEKQDGNV